MKRLSAATHTLATRTAAPSSRAPRASFASLAVCVGSALLLNACGGGQASIGGTVSGLGSGLSVVLQNNSTDNVTVTGTAATSLAFTFPTEVLAAKTYSASVLTQPAGQTCTITNPSGTIANPAVDITNIAVACVTSASVAGTVTGLRAGVAVTLLSNGVTLVLGNGAFTFPGELTAGTTYTVTVTGQPLSQTCTLTNGTGTVVAKQTAQVAVTCV